MSTGAVAHLALLAVYVLATLVPFFVSTINLSNVFGVTLALSMTAALWIGAAELTSVWCFFAAGLSVLVFVSVRRASATLIPALR